MMPLAPQSSNRVNYTLSNFFSAQMIPLHVSGDCDAAMNAFMSSIVENESFPEERSIEKQASLLIRA